MNGRAALSAESGAWVAGLEARRAHRTSPHPRPLSPGRGGRDGKSLIEMLAVMAAMSAILLTAGRLLYQLSRSERAVREASAVGRAEMRLARDFRADVRGAESAEGFAVEGGVGLRLATRGGTVEYTSNAEGVRRRAGAAREAYRLGQTAVEFGVEEGRVAVLSVDPTAQGPTRHAAAGPLRVVAAVGADRLGEPVREASPGGAIPVEAARPGGTP